MEELVIKAKNGDAQAFGELYDLYKLELYRFAYYYLNNQSDAEDAVQQAMLCAFSQIKQLKKIKSFKSWLFRILYCSCTPLIRNQSQSKQCVNIDEVRNLADLSQNIDGNIVLKDALATLTSDERSIVLLSIVCGYTSGEIGVVMDMLPATVRSKQSRALKKLRAIVL